MPSPRARTPQPTKKGRSQGTSAAGGAGQRMARLASAARDSVRGAVAGAGTGGVSVSPLPPDGRSAGDVLHPDSGHSDLPADLSKPARRALDDAGYTTLQRVAQVSESDLARLHGVGPKAIEQLRTALAAAGLSFAAKR